RREIESNDRGDHQDWHFGIYAIGLLRPVANLNLTTSLRLDYDQNYDLEFSPQLNISYLFPRLTLRASVGRSIRAADYTERYVSNNLENLSPGRNLGNPDLLAEQSWSEEIGIDYQVTDSWLLKATGFFRQSDNLIDYVNTNEAEINGVGDLQAGGDYFFARNVTEVRTNGFELESWFMPRFGENTRLQMSLGYTYLNTTNDEDVISVYISSHARHLLTSNIIFNSPKFDIGINGILKVRDAQVAEAINTSLSTRYTLWNLRASYRFVDQFALNLQIHNVFDEEYQDILGAPMPGRWIMGGFQFRF
ncbi:MAG: TonB-dependent receptor, partial [Bacteroidota bacterium]